jgi:A/G-specific adenine glycosylase
MQDADKQALAIALRERLRQALLSWFSLRQRTLPWRSEPTAYRVWLSEIMLQQTRVDTVVGYFERFVQRFPSVEALAAAPVDDVLAHWSGLGYYSRARNLHRAAKLVVEEHGGVFPQDPAALEALPGVGRYTAGAIASIAYGVPAPIVDGNVIRILSRIYDIDGDVATAAVKARIWSTAALLVPPDNASAFNQAMMELGALVCAPKRPLCGQCPVVSDCAAHKAGTALARPLKAPKPAPAAISALAVVVRSAEGAVLLLKRPEQGLFSGLWHVLEQHPAADLDATAAQALLAREYPGVATTLRSCGEVNHTLTHRRITARVWEARLTHGVPPGGAPGIWVRTPSELANLGVGRYTRKILERAGAPCVSASAQLALFSGDHDA